MRLQTKGRIKLYLYGTIDEHVADVRERFMLLGCSERYVAEWEAQARYDHEHGRDVRIFR